MSINSIVSAGNKVGRSFSLGTFLPTIGLAMWLVFVYFLSPDYGAGLSVPEAPLPDMTWLKAGVAGTVFLMLSLSLHPLIFGTTQLLEGYWGSSSLAIWAATLASRRHRARLHELERLEHRFSDRLEDDAAVAYRAAGSPSDDFARWMTGWLDEDENQRLQTYIVARDAAAKARAHYPESAHRVLPTALGNALRREEDRVGAQYGLDALTVAGHLAFLLRHQRVEDLDDARQQQDTAVHLCAAGLVAFLITCGWLLASGWSLLLALAPLLYAYISYKGAVASAREYMYTFGVFLDLNRFSLYEAMHLPLPRNGRDEVLGNLQLMQLLGGVRTSVNYHNGARGVEPDTRRDE